MGTFGWGFPLEFGGEPHSEEKIYNALRSTLGTGGYAPDDNGIDGLELRADAQALTACSAFDERAAAQFFPQLAIDNIPIYEAVLGIVPGPSATDEERRQVIAGRWTALQSAIIPTLEEALQAIDPRIFIVEYLWANSKVTLPGMPFYPYVPPPSFSPPDYSQFPLYSTRSEIYILFELGTGVVPGLPELDVIDQIRQILKIVLPAEVRPYISTDIGGLVAGVSPVGYAGVTGS